MKLNKIIMFALLAIVILAIPVSAQIKNVPPKPEDFVVYDFTASTNQPRVGEEVEFSIKVLNDGYSTPYPISTMNVNLGDGNTKSFNVGGMLENQYNTYTFTHTYNSKDIFNIDATLEFDDANIDNNKAELSLETTSNVTIDPIENSYTILVGANFQLDVNATSDGIGANLTYSISGNPSGMTINATNGLIQYNSAVEGTNTITVRVDDDYGSYNAVSFTLYVIADVAKIDILSDSITFGDYNTARGTTVTRTVIVKNTGSKVLSGLELNYSNEELRNLVSHSALPTGNLAVGDNFTLTLTTVIPSDLDGGIDVNLGTISISANSAEGKISDNTIVYFRAETGLEITEVEIYINGDKEESWDGDDTSNIFDELKEGDEVRILINVENNHNEDIEDVYVTLNIEGSSDWDFIDDEESNEEDIDEGDDFDFEIEFIVDASDLDEDSEDDVELILLVRGEDSQEDYRHYASFEFTLEIEREKDEISIINYRLSPSIAYCTTNSIELNIDFKNTGDNDQEDFLIVVESDALNFRDEYEVDELETKESDDYTFRLSIPTNMASGNYEILIKAYNEDEDLTDSVFATLEVICGDTNTNDDTNTNTGTTTTNNGFDVVNSGTNYPTGYNQFVYGENDFRESTWYLWLLILLFVVGIAGIIMLIALAVKKN